MPGFDLLIVFAIVIAFYSAVNIGGNDVANAMGTPVASKAITYRQAVLIAAVFEFSGAFFVGAHVTNTVRKGMLDMAQFAGDPKQIIYGMLAALIATTLWLRMATHYGWPVSTTHSIVGAVVGFGIVAKGVSVVNWGKIVFITSSWIVSPIIGGIIAFLLFTFIRTFVLESKDPVRRARGISPFFIFSVIFIVVLSLIYKGLKNLNLDLSFGHAMMVAALAGGIGAGAGWVWIDRKFKRLVALTGKIDYKEVENIFKFLEIITACYVAFAHGANDVANAIGPLAAIVAVSQSKEVMMNVAVPMWILTLGGSGIVLGLIILGSTVMETIGKKITEIVPSRSFSAIFGAATTVLVCSKMGLPISTTHTIVGAVIGVGFARGIGALDTKVIRDIFSSWFITIPVTMIFSAVIYKVITIFIGL